MSRPFAATLRGLALISLVTELIFLSSAPASAQCRVNELSKHFGSDVAAGDSFGDAIAISDSVFVVGSPGHSNLGVNAGAVYLFDDTVSGWVAGQKLEASDGQSFARFGSAVAIDGDVLAVGAIGIGSGAVYLFRQTGGIWSEFQKITPFDGLNQDRFGISIDLVNGRLAVGATGHDGSFLDEGAVYLYQDQGSQWDFETKLQASDSFFSDHLGRLSLTQDRLAVTSSSGQGGSCYVFRFDGSAWIEEQKITHPLSESGDDFGASVSLNQERLCIGAPAADQAGVMNAGKVYVYTHSMGNWIEEQVISPPDPQPNGFFGIVDLDSDKLLVGAPLTLAQGDGSGIVYFYRRVGGIWILDYRCQPSDSQVSKGFGSAFALEGDYAIIGASSDPSIGPLAGSCYVASSFASGLRLLIDPPAAAPGTPLTFEARFGPPISPQLLAIVAVDGIPNFVPVFVTNFDPTYRWRLTFPMPPGASGLTISLQSLGVSLCGEPVNSPTATFQAL